MAGNMIGDIISNHRERMLNLKKYYPFFKLMDASFSQYRDGKYDMLDMGYIVMAVLRFFIEENNFKEKDVTYPEYFEFVLRLLERDFGLLLNAQEGKEIADYIFNKIKNDGRPFEFSYYDPVEQKKKISRTRIIESTIRENTVWYSISADAVEFYLDTKEIRDESKISVSQLLLEKMLHSQNFRGGIEVVQRINEEVCRLKRKKNEVAALLAADVFAGIEAYEEFVETGMKWFADEEKLFKKNSELVARAIETLEDTPDKGERYYRTLNEIYSLEEQLKVAMNKHSELLRDCTDMQRMTDEAVRKAKLGRLRVHMDFTAALADMIQSDNADILVQLLTPLLRPNIRKTFNVTVIDEALTVKPERYEEREESGTDSLQDIEFDDEIEDRRIGENYRFLMHHLICCLKKSDRISLSDFNSIMREQYGEKLFKNADYYSFFVNLCRNGEYVIGGESMRTDSFLDAILREEFQGVEQITFSIAPNGGSIHITDDIEVSDVDFIRG